MFFESLRRTTTIIGTFAAVAIATTCQAHFLWVKTVEVDGKPQGLLFFGENPAEETYHFPDKLAKTKLWSRAADGKRTEVATKSIETDDRIGHMGRLTDEKAPVKAEIKDVKSNGFVLFDNKAGRLFEMVVNQRTEMTMEAMGMQFNQTIEQSVKIRLKSNAK